MNGFGDAGVARGIAASQEDCFGRDGASGIGAGEQPLGRSLGSPVAAQQFQKLRRQQRLPILTTFADRRDRDRPGRVVTSTFVMDVQ